MSRAFIALLLSLSGGVAIGAEKVFDFREMATNATPPGFRSAVAGSGQPGEWKVILDQVPSLMEAVSPRAQPLGRRPVLAQLSRDRTDEHFPLLIHEEETFGDFTLTTRLKLVEGEEEQMAGIAFRLQDERNYYYVRASALGNTFGLIKVLRGRRVEPALLVNMPVAKGVWHELTIECKATKVRVSFNGKEVISSYDDQSESFTSGKVAYWTKSDAVSYFTDTVISYKPRESLAQTLVREAFKKYPRLLGLKIYAAAPPEISAMQVVASLDPAEVGQLAPVEAHDVLQKQGYYYGRGSGKVMLTLPLRDNNGDKVAAIRVVMKSFPGQTEKNAVARAMPVVQSMETRIQTLKDLIQ